MKTDENIVTISNFQFCGLFSYEKISYSKADESILLAPGFRSVKDYLQKEDYPNVAFSDQIHIQGISYAVHMKNMSTVFSLHYHKTISPFYIDFV